MTSKLFAFSANIDKVKAKLKDNIEAPFQPLTFAPTRAYNCTIKPLEGILCP